MAILLVFCLGKTGAQEIIRGPYLQLGTPTSMTVRWRTDGPTDSRVVAGRNYHDLSDTVITSSMTTEHELILSGLIPLTRYFYAVGSSSELLAGGDSAHFFWTSPLPGSQKKIRLWAIGDAGFAGMGPLYAPTPRAVRDAYLRYTGDTYTQVWLMLGDNAYSMGTDAQYQTAVFQDMYEDLLRTTPAWSAYSNHDSYSADAGSQSGVYFNIFSFPTQGEAGGTASGTEAYYSFNYGRVHFITLNATDMVMLDVSGEQYKWLETDLLSTDQDWIIVFTHQPPHSHGSHNSDTESNMVALRRDWLPLMENYGVDVVLSGHSHSYERSFLIDGYYGKSEEFAANPGAYMLDGGDGREDGDGPYEKEHGPHNGTVCVVAGVSGGARAGGYDHAAMAVSIRAEGSVVMDIIGNQLQARFLDTSGTVRDSFTILKHFHKPDPEKKSGILFYQTSEGKGVLEINIEYKFNIELRNLKGEVVLTDSGSDEKKLIVRKSSFPPGRYILYVTGESGVYYKRLVLR
ncbi:metallophosphoesterase [Fibrobacterota bacterium]